MDVQKAQMSDIDALVDMRLRYLGEDLGQLENYRHKSHTESTTKATIQYGTFVSERQGYPTKMYPGVHDSGEG